MEFIAVLAGVGIRLLTALGKKYSIPSKYTVVFLAAVMGLAYAIFKGFAPPEMQEKIVGLIGISMSTSWVIYEFLTKKD